MSTAIRSALLVVADAKPARAPVATTQTQMQTQTHAPGAPATATRFSALDWIFTEQQDLTAVERFARQHEEHALPAHSKFYRDLIPSTAPGANQQYAFEVDLDLCTGCKACVTGCHSMNGLDDGEVWRTVGTLYGGSAEAPAHQTVTTSCHHCADPACLSGCPVKAYEKDPVTGIVRHLDDQCIGCQYCVLMCPYDAPKYNEARGIVRKCDMCSDRLAHGEAPACVQSCPSEAIRITVVHREDAVRAAAADKFLPGAPAPAATQPTTVYKNGRSLSASNLVPGDLHDPPPQHAHPPLVFMLALTQLSVGALIINLLVRALVPHATGATEGRTLELANVLVALCAGVIAMAVMPLHLGRPQYAFRAFLGLRTSWLSREILAFSAFMGLFVPFAATFFLPEALVPSAVRAALGIGAAVTGLAGVACSVMVYAATRRAHWRASVTAVKFTLSSLILGSASVQAVSLIVSAESARGSVASAPAFVRSGAFDLLTAIVVVSVLAKLLFERGLWMARAAIPRLAPALETARRARFWFGAIGGIALPMLGLAAAQIGIRAAGVFPLSVLTLTATGALLGCLAGELCERYLFFAAAPASKMPGALA